VTNKDKKYKYTEIKRVEYLKSIQQRIEDDVCICLTFLKKHNQGNSRKIGFWISVRIIMPVIEATAKTLGIGSEELLNKMGIETPFLMWDMYRNSLMHIDQLNSVEYKKIKIGWGISIEGFSCFTKKQFIHFDADDIVKRLKKILQEEIKKNDETIVRIPTVIVYKNPDKKIISEFKLLEL